MFVLAGCQSSYVQAAVLTTLRPAAPCSRGCGAGITEVVASTPTPSGVRRRGHRWGVPAPRDALQGVVASEIVIFARTGIARLRQRCGAWSGSGSRAAAGYGCPLG